MSRDNARTPMQWDSSPQAGFTTSEKPWLAVNPNYKEINAASQLVDPGSVYHYTQRMIALRHRTPALVYGDFKDLDPANPRIFAYTRTLGAGRYLVVLNFSRDQIVYHLPDGLIVNRLLVSNLRSREVNASTLNLRGWEARVYSF
jgi:oligo-1,6-glucosidase